MFWTYQLAAEIMLVNTPEYLQYLVYTNYPVSTQALKANIVTFDIIDEIPAECEKK